MVIDIRVNNRKQRLHVTPLVDSNDSLHFFFEDLDGFCLLASRHPNRSWKTTCNHPAKQKTICTILSKLEGASVYMWFDKLAKVDIPGIAFE